MSMASGVSAGIIVGDKEWRQVTETVNFSWNDFSSVCDATTGACSSGTLSNSTVGTVSFDGWTWASQGDVAGLFRGLDGWDGPPATDSFYHDNEVTTWAPAIFDALGFLPTLTGSSFRDIIGISRTLTGIVSLTPYISDSFNPLLFDSADTTDTTLFWGRFPDRGGWFYKTATTTPSAPAPPTLALL